MLSSVCLAWVLTGAVGLEVEAVDGLDPSERQVLTQELERAVTEVIGQAPSPDPARSLAVRARRVGWRVQISVERRQQGRAVGRETIDLTRDARSWRTPLTDAIRRLLPEGAALASIEAPVVTPAPPVAVPTPPVALPPPAPVMTAQPPVEVVTFDHEHPSSGASKIFPLLAIGGGVACAIVGVNFVSNASDAISAATFSTNQDVIEEQQRAVFENAVLGSVFLSVGSAAVVTGLILLIGG